MLGWSEIAEFVGLCVDLFLRLCTLLEEYRFAVRLVGSNSIFLG